MGRADTMLNRKPAMSSRAVDGTHKRSAFSPRCARMNRSWFSSLSADLKDLEGGKLRRNTSSLRLPRCSSACSYRCSSSSRTSSFDTASRTYVHRNDEQRAIIRIEARIFIVEPIAERGAQILRAEEALEDLIAHLVHFFHHFAAVIARDLQQRARIHAAVARHRIAQLLPSIVPAERRLARSGKSP